MPSQTSSQITCNLARAEISKLHRQRILGRIFLLPLALILALIAKFRFRFSVENQREIRSQFREIARRGKPLMICANHLTMIDSIIIMLALCPITTYLLNYRLLCWNIPAIENFAHKPLWRLVTYLGKCIPIDRQGSDDHKNEVIDKLQYLLSIGDIAMVFPEGTRSRTGRIVPENVTYGVGRIMLNVPECEVLCIYLRGHDQETYSFFPKMGERFYMKMELIAPKTNDSGRRAIRDLSVQTINRIKNMEDEFFSNKDIINSPLQMTA